MAHVIDMSNHRENMAYIGATPWQGLGQKLEEGQSIEQWRIAAGMGWDCLKVPELMGFNGKVMETGDYILQRGDTGAKLGNCKERYQVVQPRDVMEFFRDLTDHYGFVMDTAGCLDDGRKVWALARVGEPLIVMGQDKINQYCLLATSFDGSLSTIARFTSVRVVCNNTLTAANAERGQLVVKTSHSTCFKPNQVKIDLGIVEDHWAKFGVTVNKMAQTKITRDQAFNMICNAFDVKKDDEISTRKKNIIEGVFTNYLGSGKGAQMDSSKDTVWGAVNAVTQFVDHSQGNNANNRLRSAWFGEGEKLKNKIFEQGMQVAAQ